MKKFNQRVQVLVEFRSLGASVLGVSLRPSLRMGLPDSVVFNELILRRILNDDVRFLSLDDGNFLVVPASISASSSLTADQAVSRNVKLSPFDISILLEDGQVHSCKFSLALNSDSRHDYTVGLNRFLVLDGVVELEVEENETSEVDA